MKIEEKTKMDLLDEIQRLRRLLSVKDRQEKTKKYQKRLETLPNFSSDMIILKDKNLRYLFFNEAYLKFVNKGSEDIIGKTDLDVMPEEIYERCRQSDENALRTDTPIENEEYMLGMWVHIVKRRIVDEEGNIDGIVVMIRDITKHKEAVEALSKSTQLLEKTFASLSDAIFIIDAGTVEIIDCNPTASKMFGYSRREMLGRNTAFLHIDKAALEEFRRNLNISVEKEGFLSQFEFSMKRKDGTVFPTEHCVMPLEGKEKKQTGWVSVVRDITKRKKMEEEFLKAQKLESISLIAGGIAHDFNNFLTGILGNIYLAKHSLPPSDKLFEILTGAEKASLHAKNLAGQLLTFSKGGEPVKKTIIIGELIKNWCAFVLRGSKVQHECIIPEDLWPVEVDNLQIHQVINNLIINADQAMPDGGYIKVQADNININAKDIPTLKEGKYVKISIEDHGIGIPAKHLRKIFDPFFTTKENGSGLGLAIAYSAVKKHDGHITVKSKVGIGTIFYIYLPASSKDVTREKDEDNSSIHGKGKILVMDDEEIIRDFVRNALGHFGYEVVSCRDGVEAMELYKRAKEAGHSFDAVIMDLTIPGGMGGKETIKELLKINPEAKVIVSSGYSKDSIMANHEIYGFSDVLVKPYTHKELCEVIHRVTMRENN